MWVLMPIGRPSSFTPEIGEEICIRIAQGESLRKVCASEGMPDKGTVMRWLFHSGNEDFRDQYARARMALMEHYAEDITDISDDSAGDWTETDDGPRPNPELVQRAKLRVDTRKWLMSKLLPKKYGERLEMEHTGTIQHQHMTVDEFQARLLKAREA